MDMGPYKGTDEVITILNYQEAPRPLLMVPWSLNLVLTVICSARNWQALPPRVRGLLVRRLGSLVLQGNPCKSPSHPETVNVTKGYTRLDGTGLDPPCPNLNLQPPETINPGPLEPDVGDVFNSNRLRGHSIL